MKALKQLLLIISLLTSFQTFSQTHTEHSDTSCIGLADTITVKLINPKTALGPVNLTFWVRAYASFQTFKTEVYSENQSYLGHIVGNCNIYKSLTVTVPADSFNAWNANGQIEFTYILGSNNGCSPNECAYITADYTTAAGTNNSGVQSIDIANVLTPGTNNIYATIANFGTTTIDSVEVYWSLNGLVQPKIIHTGLLQSSNFGAGYQTSVVLGSVNMLANNIYKIKVWTANPNGSIDMINADDTLSRDIETSMAGIYTINDGLPASSINFTSFNIALASLARRGIGGPVSFNVSGGPYNEKIKIENYRGNSASNNITINGNGCKITDSGTPGDYAIVLLDGVDFLVIDSLHIEGSALVNQYGVQFINQADHNIIRNCTIQLSKTTTHVGVVGVRFRPNITPRGTEGLLGSHNLLENNLISGGYYGVRVFGTSTHHLVGNNLINNRIHDFYSHAVYYRYCDTVLVKGNDISRKGRTTFTDGHGIYFTNVNHDCEISGNRIHHMFGSAPNSGTDDFYGISVATAFGNVGHESKVFNNIISNNYNYGDHVLMSFANGSGYWFMHNTLVADNPAPGTTGTTLMFVNSATSSNLKFKNNLVYLTRATAASKSIYNISSNSFNLDIDNNIFYMPDAGSGNATFSGSYGVTNDLAAWSGIWRFGSNSFYDKNSTMGDPYFSDRTNGDFRPNSPTLLHVGTNLLSLVPTDIDGLSRSNSPFPGAHEFNSTSGSDLGVSSINKPDSLSCLTNHNLRVNLFNKGTNNISYYRLKWWINGVEQSPIVSSTNPFASLDTGSTYVGPISTIGKINFTVSVKIDSIFPGTNLTTKDSASVTFNAGLQGNYNITHGISNDSVFSSFTQLADALNTYGVCGPVTVNVTNSSNPFTERFVLNEVQGVSSINTITINGNGNTIQHLSATTRDVATVELNGTDWLTIDSLNVKALGNGVLEDGYGIVLTNRANHNTIRKCNITAGTSSYLTHYAGIAMSGSNFISTDTGKAGSFNLIEDNIISGGNYGIACNGSGIDTAYGNVFSNNEIKNFGQTGIGIAYTNQNTISGNNIHRENITSNYEKFEGVQVRFSGSSKIIGNKIHDPFKLVSTSTRSAQGIVLNSIRGSSASPTVVANNIIYNMVSDGNIDGIYTASYIEDVRIINNTIVVDDATHQSSTNYYSAGVHFTGSHFNSQFSNNILYFNRNAGGMSVVMREAISFAMSIENNAYYAPPVFVNNFGFVVGKGILDYNGWKKEKNYDQTSVFANPYFVNTLIDDFTPQSVYLDSNGIDFSSINTLDINGNSRGTLPDMGAIEFTPNGCTGLRNQQIELVDTIAKLTWVALPGDSIIIEWGAVGYKTNSVQPLGAATIPAGDSIFFMSNLSSNSCYEYYLDIACSNSFPGLSTPIGPFSFCTPCFPLSGNYTVGGTSGPGNFGTLDSAISTIMDCGLGGHVTLNLQGGNHQPISFVHLPGAGPNSTLTINGSTNFGDSIVINNTTRAFDFDSTSYVIIQGMYIQKNSPTTLVRFRPGSNHIKLINCKIIGDTLTSSTSPWPIIDIEQATNGLSGQANNSAHHITIEGCEIVGGGRNIDIHGKNESDKSRYYLIKDNVFRKAGFGMSCRFLDSLFIEGNQFRDFSIPSPIAISIEHSSNIALLDNYLSSGYVRLRFVNRSTNPSAPKLGLIANNFMTGRNAGIGLLSSHFIKIYHNSIVSKVYAIKMENGGPNVPYYTNYDIDIRNNILVSRGTASQVPLNVFNPPLGTFNVDYNLYFAPGADVAYIGLNSGPGTYYTDLSAWKAANPSLNANSLERDPNFISYSDLHLNGVGAVNMGVSGLGPLLDIDGDPRPGSGSAQVDIGADEFSPLAVDGELIDILVDEGCGNGATDISVVIKNNGASAISGIIANVIISGTSPNTLSANYSGSLSSGNVDTFSVGTINTLAGDTLSFNGNITLSGDLKSDNNTITLSWDKIFVPNSLQVTNPDSICFSNDSILLSSIGYPNLPLAWYSNATDLLPISETDSLKVSGSNPSTWYLGYDNIPDSLNLGYTGDFDVSGNAFDVIPKKDLLIDGFNIHTDRTSSLTVNVYWRAGTYLGHEKSISGWQLHETLNLTGSGANQPTACKFTNPVSLNSGQKYSFMVVVTSAGARLSSRIGVEHNAINKENADIALYQGVAVSWPLSNYNLAINFDGSVHYRANPCRQTKKPVTILAKGDTASASFKVTRSQALYTFDASASVNANLYVWDFGDGSLLGNGVSVSHNYTTPGNYTVKLTVLDTVGCKSLDSAFQNFIVSIGLDEYDNWSKGIKIYPNPTKGQVTIDFTYETQNDRTIQLFDATGMQVLHRPLTPHRSESNLSIDLSDLPDGLYTLKILERDFTLSKKIIKQ